MKKVFIILVAVLFAYTTSFAEDAIPEDENSQVSYGAEDLDHQGAGTQDGTSGIDDLSYDDATGSISMYVICELDITPENDVLNIGYMNPDGSRSLNGEYLQWQVKGGNGWYFEAWLKNDQFARNSSGQKTNYVYFVNPTWKFRKGNNGGFTTLSGTTTSGEFDQEMHVTQLQLSGTVGSTNNNPNPCNGKATFRFKPNKVVATELAVDDLYTWNVWLAVDYLTWTAPVDPDGSAYTQPGTTTNPPDHI